MSDIKAFVICIALFAAVAAIVAVGLVVIHLTDAPALRACRDRGGQVDYFDSTHPDNWRCVTTPERAP